MATIETDDGDEARLRDVAVEDELESAYQPAPSCPCYVAGWCHVEREPLGPTLEERITGCWLRIGTLNIKVRMRNVPKEYSIPTCIYALLTR